MSEDLIARQVASSGLRLLLLRRVLRYSQNDWCKILGITQPSLSNIENGHTKISISHAIIVYKHTGATLDWIYLGLEQGLPHPLAALMTELDPWRQIAGGIRSTLPTLPVSSIGGAPLPGPVILDASKLSAMPAADWQPEGLCDLILTQTVVE
jgi:transcriptional regulator with XRE-family HTH domain